MDSFGASETGARGHGDSTSSRGGPRFTMNEHDERARRGRAARSHPGPGAVGQLARLRPHPARLLQGRGEDRGHVPRRPRRQALGDPRRLRDHRAPTARSTLLGRGSVCINTGGEKVFPEEVEAALKAHPAVFDAVVVGVPDERFHGARRRDRDARRESRTIELDELQEFCRTKIAGYKVPRRAARHRRDPPHTRRQARLPLGQANRHRHERSRRSDMSTTEVPATLGFWKIATARPDHLALVDPDEQLVSAGELLGVVQPARARAARAGPPARRRGRDAAAELRRGVRAVPRRHPGRLLPRSRSTGTSSAPRSPTSSTTARRRRSSRTPASPSTPQAAADEIDFPAEGRFAVGGDDRRVPRRTTT